MNLSRAAGALGNSPRQRSRLYIYVACAVSLGILGIPLGAAAQAVPAAANCVPAAKMKAAQIYGLWRVTFTAPPADLPATATMLLERHAEFSESLAGFISRDLGAAAGSPAIAGHSSKARLAGDLEDGILVLDESSDNISITGTWNGEVVESAESSCGRLIRGVWKDTSKSAPPDAPEIPFTLTPLKTP